MRFATKELSKRTFPDFERLFSLGNGWDFCWCTAYQRGVSGGTTRRGRHVEGIPRNRAEWGEVNHKDKRELAMTARAHGIIVYSDGDPIGWCQFGPADELPITGDTAGMPRLDDTAQRLWKVTCFVTMKAYQGRGVAGVALHAALGAIRKAGGGRVEGYPYAHIMEPPPPDPLWRDLIRKHGSQSSEVKRIIMRREGPVTYYAGRAFLRHDAIVDGVGPVNAVYWRGIGMFHAGTVAMFQREGFRAVGILPSPSPVRSPWLQASRVVMEKLI